MTPGRRRTLRWCAITLTVIAVPATVLYFRNEQTIDPFVAEQVRIFGYATGDNRLLSELSRGRVRSGDPVEDFLAAHPPDLLVRHGDYVTMNYRVESESGNEGVHVVAKHGKLIIAKKYGPHPHVHFFRDDSAIGYDYAPSYNAEQSRASNVQYQARLALTGSVGSYSYYPTSAPLGPSGK